MIKKLEMKYLVLKLSDEINIKKLQHEIDNYIYDNNVTVKDISLILVNCIKIGD